MNLGCLNIPENTLIVDQLKITRMSGPPSSQQTREARRVWLLSRMAGSAHRKISITPNDVIIFSSHPIPGNEKAVTKVINELSMKGAEVIFQDVHVGDMPAKKKSN